jgi:hypothetical protein
MVWLWVLTAVAVLGEPPAAAAGFVTTALEEAYPCGTAQAQPSR